MKLQPEGTTEAPESLLRWRQFGLPELLAALAVMSFALALGWLTPLDQWVAGWFYQPGGATDWPWGDLPAVMLFYYSAPLLASLLGLAGVGLWMAGRRTPQLRPWRWHGAYLFLVLALGPGLVINAMFKDYSGRPRPRQTIEFGGTYAHRAPLEFGKIAAGKSFPAGHASVGFAFAALYFVLRPHRRRLAFAVLVGSLVLGGAMGLGRMAAGAHFLSDVLCAGALTFLVAHLTYFFVLKIPLRECLAREKLTSKPRHFSLGERIAYGAAALLIAGVLLLAYPYHKRFTSGWILPEPLATVPVDVTIFADRGNVVLDFSSPEQHLQLEGEFHGFGLPEKSVRESVEMELGETGPRLYYRHLASGRFTDFEGRVVFHFDRTGLRQLEATARDGIIQVRGLTEESIPPEWTLQGQAVVFE